MSSTISTATHRRRTTTKPGRAAALAVLVALGAGCASDSSASSDATVAVTDVPAATAPAPAPATAPATTTAATTAAVSSTAPEAAPADDRGLAEDAILAPADLGESWITPDPPFEFPNDAELARNVPSCAAFAELVFNGGADHGEGIGTAMLIPDTPSVVFTYVVVFPTVDDATAMIEAVSTPEFDICWTDFNVAAMKVLLGDGSDASYESKAPPELTIDADAYTVKSLDGFMVVGGNTTVDTCICAFSQVGRAVVEVHSAADVFEPAERSRVVQLAIDKMSATLAAAD